MQFSLYRQTFVFYLRTHLQLFCMWMKAWILVKQRVIPLSAFLSQEQVLYSTTDAAVQAVNARLPYADDAEYQSAFAQVLQNAEQIWNEKAVTVNTEKAVSQLTDLSEIESAYDQSSPGMLVQFTTAGLIGTAIILVQERRTKTLQRMLTTAISGNHPSSLRIRFPCSLLL